MFDFFFVRFFGVECVFLPWLDSFLVRCCRCRYCCCFFGPFCVFDSRSRVPFHLVSGVFDSAKLIYRFYCYFFVLSSVLLFVFAPLLASFPPRNHLLCWFAVCTAHSLARSLSLSLSFSLFFRSNCLDLTLAVAWLIVVHSYCISVLYFALFIIRSLVLIDSFFRFGIIDLNCGFYFACYAFISFISFLYAVRSIFRCAQIFLSFFFFWHFTQITFHLGIDCCVWCIRKIVSV